MIDNIFNIEDLSDIPECREQILKRQLLNIGSLKMNVIKLVMRHAREKNITDLKIENIFVACNRLLKKNNDSISINTLKSYLNILSKEKIIICYKAKKSKQNLYCPGY